RGASGAPHRVVERLADLVVGGAGLLRSREAAGHSGGAAGRRHRGQGHELHRLRVERALPVVDAGELLHLPHGRPPLARVCVVDARADVARLPIEAPDYFARAPPDAPEPPPPRVVIAIVAAMRSATYS